MFFHTVINICFSIFYVKNVLNKDLFQKESMKIYKKKLAFCLMFL